MAAPVTPGLRFLPLVGWRGPGRPGGALPAFPRQGVQPWRRGESSIPHREETVPRGAPEDAGRCGTPGNRR